jgi:ABC-type branched-subunit amino acid transport system permease subunit
MATQATPKKSAFSWLDSVRSWANETMIAGRPVIWYVTGWRFAVIALIVTVILPFIPYGVYTNIQALVVAMTSVWVYVLLALGLNVVVGYAGLLDLGYVAFFVIGSYTFAAGTFGFLHAWTGDGFFTVPTFPLVLLLPIGALLAGIGGVLLGAPTLRLRGDYLAIVTLGFGEIVPIIFQNVPTFYGNIGMSAVPPAPIVVGGITLVNFQDPLNNAPFYFLTLGVTILIVFGVLALRDSSVGRAWIAIREDETAAEASGVNLTRTKLLAFGLGAFVGGVGGVLNTAFVPAVLPANFNFSVSITVLIMIVLGGIGSVPGVIVGAIILRLVDAYLLGLINDPIHQSALVAPTNAPLHFLANVDFNVMKYLIYGVVLILMIVLRPQGIIPDARRKRELKGIGAAPESVSAVGMFEIEESGGDLATGEALDQTTYVGEGSDAQGRDG